MLADGDFSPGSTESRIFTIFFILIGVGGAFPALGSLLSIIVDPTTAGGREALEKLFPQKRIDIDGDGTCDYVVPSHWAAYYAKNLLPSFTLNLLVQLVSAVFFMILEPAWTFGDAFYHCIITATTVGYGDVTITTQGGRLWAGFQILISVVLLGELISTISTLQKARESHLKRSEQLQARLDEQLVPRLMARVTELRPPTAAHANTATADRLLAEQGLTELEYVLANLIELEMVSAEDIQPFVKSFREMDSDGSGRLNQADVESMAKRRREKQRMERRKIRASPTRSTTSGPRDAGAAYSPEYYDAETIRPLKKAVHAQIAASRSRVSPS